MIVGSPQLDICIPNFGTELAFSHSWPLFFNRQLDVVADSTFEFRTNVTRERLRVPVQVCEIVCFLLDRSLRPIVSFPNGNRGEAKEYRIDDANDGIDKAGHVVVALQNLNGYQPAHK